MAESAMFSVASNLLRTIDSPAFKIALERAVSIRGARDEIDKLKRTIMTVQSVLLDAEKKQDSSSAVKNWIKRVSDVLYDADDLFDEVVTDYMLRQQIKGDSKRLLSKVRVSCSKLNPIISGNSAAKKVKSIRKSLLELSIDMAQFNFVRSTHEVEEKSVNMRRGQDPGSFVDPEDVIGRDEDKKAILELLFDESENDELAPVIAIVGIGGMGKSTLAQLIYNDKEVRMNFEKRWFACISDITDENQVVGKIFQSITGENFGDFTVSQLYSRIRESVNGSKFLLVLDNVWDDNHARWQNRMSLLGVGGAKGSRIIVTTRSLSVARAVYALRTHFLKGLSEEASWILFKSVTGFTPEQEEDSRWSNLGREIVKKCAGVPLAIKSIGALLSTKSTLQEWESFGHEKGLNELYYGDPIMQVLKLSYDHLPSTLKHCFAYCSLFPKGSEFEIKKLVYLWIAQGYINPNHEKQTIEQVGYSYFMELFRRSFFQEAIENEHGEVVSCKMHDLMHEMAQRMAGKDIVVLNWPSNQFMYHPRHVGVHCEKGNPCEILESLVGIDRLRSLVLKIGDSRVQALDQQFTNLKFLRALSLSDLGIVNVSSSIAELKHLRYLDLSHNKFASLPGAMANLVNLLTLDIEGCYNLKQLPENFRKLINLRYLNNRGCYELEHMPPGIGELHCLQYLSCFKVGKTSEGVKSSGLDELAGLTQLAGELLIDFDMGIEDWDGDESWELPVSARQLCIWEYPGRRIPCWGNERENNLAYLHLGSCLKVRYLPPLRHLPNLRFLSLRGLPELEYMEEEEIEGRYSCVRVAESSVALFFPCLEQLELRDLPKLKGWSRNVAAISVEQGIAADKEEHSLLSFHLLSQLTIIHSPELKSIPLSPFIQKLELYSVDSDLVQQLLSTWSNSSASYIPPSSSLKDLSITDCERLLSFPKEALASLQSFCIDRCSSLETLHLASLNLLSILIRRCHELKGLQVEALESLRSLKIEYCNRLNSLHIAHLGVLEELFISDCPELKLWELQDNKCPLDWDSLPKLHSLFVDSIPPPEKLPECFRYRIALGQLQITVKPIKKQRSRVQMTNLSSSRPTTSTEQEA